MLIVRENKKVTPITLLRERLWAMKILIENATIVTMNTRKPIITNGYVYIDKGKIIAVGEGVPPPELELADYVIEGSGRVVTPGFVIGLGDILMYAFRYVVRENESKLREILGVLTKDEIVDILEVALTSLAMHGVTSIVSMVINSEVLPLIAKAVSETWIRTRSVLKNVNPQDYGAFIHLALRNVTEPDAISKEIVTFGYYTELRRDSDISRKALEYIEGTIYLTLDRLEYVPARIIEKAVCLNCPDTVTQILTYNAVVNDFNLWKAGQALVFTKAKYLNPRFYLHEISRHVIEAYDRLALITTWNSKNLRLGMDSIDIGKLADIVILNFREPPGGPLPADVPGIVEAIADGDYVVETVIVGGEIVIDRGEPLMVGTSLFKRVAKICDSIRGKA